MSAANIVSTDVAWSHQEQRLQVASLIAVISAMAGIALFIKIAIVNIEAPDAFKDMRVAEAGKAAAALRSESLILILISVACALIGLSLGIYARRTLKGKVAIFLVLSPVMLCIVLVLFNLLCRF